ncbi:hypothetical protein ACIQUX_32410 [Streptomyces sp. NPDC101133]|uniref:hypothetical protein n=1 Tax=Streptomyces sp. NPDC101133 TaxID=3366111 RepID=UPI00381659CA
MTNAEPTPEAQAETMAERRRRALEVNRTDQLADMRERLRELGDHTSLTELDAAMAGWQSTEWAGQYTDPLTGMLELTTADVKSALREQGIPQERLDSVQVCTVPQDDVSALMTPFADRSGLVTISDSVLSLAGQYAQYTGRGLARLSAGPVRGRLRAFRSVTRGTLEEDPAVLTAYLRYYNVNQRVYGLSAKLGLNASPKEAETGSLVALQATRFVIGHEIAHHALGHSSPASAFSPGERLPVCSPDQRRELDADMLAYRAAERAAERDFARVTAAVPAHGFTALLGALVAMVALHATERALFVRCGATHPPARARATLLLDQAPPAEQQIAGLFLHPLVTATEDASAFGEAGRPFDWERVAASRELSSSQPDSYLRAITLLDTLQCQSRDALVEILERTAPDAGVWLTDGARLVNAGEPAAALALWGVPEAVAERQCDPGRALRFHSLVAALRKSLTARGMPDRAILSTSVAAAQLTATALSEGR